MLEHLLTEQQNPASHRLSEYSTGELLRIINAEDHKVAAAVEKEIPRIVEAVDAVSERLDRGGRLFYAGAGTSGRLGVLDASECPPTFGVEPDQVQALIAGGRQAMFESQEGAEDRTDTAEDELRERSLSAKDALVGISASGRTPYVIAALDYARGLGAAAIGLTCNPGSELAGHCDITIAPAPGPEAVTGSTRMKAGTAQKLVLNMLSTAVMVRRGYVLGNLMVGVQLKSAKLVDRARRIVAELGGCDPHRAAEILEQSGNDVRTAILMGRLDVEPAQARGLLKNARGNLWKALQSAQQ